MMGRARAGLVALSVCLALGGCQGTTSGVVTDPLIRARHLAESSTDGEVVGRWLFGELVEPGGEPTQVTAARRQLDSLKPRATGLYASLSRAVDDETHGRLGAAATEFIEALDAARTYEGPEASMLAWYAANHLAGLRESVPHLWAAAKPVVERAIERPEHIGFRARSELVDYWALEETASGGHASFEQLTRERAGCATNARFAGPFGRLAPADTMRHFDAEAPGPWPLAFAPDPARTTVPRVLAAKAHGCHLVAEQAVDPGVYYVETFVTLEETRDVVVAVEGSTSVLLDDVEVLRRDPDEWGTWPRFAVRAHLKAGRHRLVARLAGADTSIRVVDEQGRPLEGASSVDPSPLYSLVPPELQPDPNPLAPFLDALGLPASPKPPAVSSAFRTVDAEDPLLRFVSATLAHLDGQDDLASVILEPLVKDTGRATGVSLSLAASLIESDPIFTPNDARDLALDLRKRATDKDSSLWYPRLWLALDQAGKQGVTDVLPKLTELAAQFDEVPGIIKGLAAIYSRLGWKAEHENAILEAARRFPDDTEVLRAELGLFDERGQFAEADKTVERLRVLDPRGLIDVERAVRRGDYGAAITALEKAKVDHPEEQAIAARIEDLLTRAGKNKETFALLEKALANDPKNEKARLSLADAQFAAGKQGALREALVDAIRKGAETNGLRDALELVEGASELSAYRIDGLATIHEYEASGAAARGLAKTADLPKGGPDQKKDSFGNTARVLDYSALWIRADGTARMLEHEILHMQSSEAIKDQAEQRIPRGVLLHIRTVKPDGTIFEPEIIGGKPTVTMPHLDVGDYIETETIYSLPGDGTGGRSFVGPRWFFREEKVDYYRSEFVIVSPRDKPLDIETTGDVPAPAMKEEGALVTRRYRVDQTPAVPEERFGAPIEEFLPSVRVGWGVSQKDTLDRFVDLASVRTPRDPRLVRIAETILANGKKGDEAKTELAGLSVDEKARRIYRWVAANVEAGKENDPRKVVTGKSGARVEAFLYLARLVDVNVERGLVVDRLAAPPNGPMAEAEMFATLAVAVPSQTSGKPATADGKADYRWMLVGDKFAPYGFLPSSLRKQPAVLLLPGAPRTTTSAGGAEDGVEDSGDVVLAADGSATISLEETYRGRLAIGLRSGLSTLPEARIKEAVESQMLPDILPGARLVSVDMKNLEDLDAPLTLSMKIEVSSFATPNAGGLRLPPPFSPGLSGLVNLSSRQTPLFIPEQLAVSHKISLRIHLPKGGKVTLPSTLPKVETPGISYAIEDRVDGDTLVLERHVEMPAGRVQPADYPAFAKIVREMDQAFDRDISIDVR